MTLQEIRHAIEEDGGLFTDRPTLMWPYSGRHIDNGATTVCGFVVPADAVRFAPEQHKRISCSYCWSGRLVQR